ncbi:MAG: hypothetical protein J3R72DRAFT_432637 [Linnemannia gamsii]|nr:MAG: hypothetical protein J3R72DRAFT_432637 [Linnemannia gamsii]
MFTLTRTSLFFPLFFLGGTNPISDDGLDSIRHVQPLIHAMQRSKERHLIRINYCLEQGILHRFPYKYCRGPAPTWLLTNTDIATPSLQTKAASTAYTHNTFHNNQTNPTSLSTMTQLSLKVVSAIVLAAFAAQAAPLLGSPDCTGASCYQSASSGSVDVASTTNVVPETNITPITRIQPYVQAHAPIVYSDCDYGLYGDYGYGGGHYGGGGGLYGGGGGRYGGGGGLYGGIGSGYYNRGYGRGLLGSNRGMYGRSSLLKRQAPAEATSAPADQASGNLLFNQFQSQTCPAGDIACQTNVPAQNVDLGSSTSISPSTAVFPSTVYRPQVQSLDSDIQAAPAQANTLPQQGVNLGSNVFIQPQTSVSPQTTYQPSVSQLATDVQAVAQQDQSLPQSSVQLGSTVQIAPTVNVQPLTTFQSTIQSLPFNIQVEPCREINYVQGTATTLPAPSGQFAGSSPLYAGRFPPAVDASAGPSGPSGASNIGSSLGSSMDSACPSSSIVTSSFGGAAPGASSFGGAATGAMSFGGSAIGAQTQTQGC